MSTDFIGEVDRAIDILKAALASYTQTTRLLALSTTLGPNILIADRFSGVECVGECYADDGAPVSGFRFEIVALSTDAHLQPAALLGTAARLDLTTDNTLDARRYFHGYVTAFEQLGSNGGFARYRLVIEPWTALLRLRRDSYVFQDMSVIEIIDEVFGDYAGQGALVPLWRWHLAEADAYPARSLCIQHGESDHDFVQRLLAEEGLFAWFEHIGGADGVEGDVGGQHVLVIADRNEAFGSAASGRSGAALGPVRYHRAAAMEQSDTIQQFHARAAITPYTVELSSWDYVSLDTRPVAHGTSTSGAAPALSRVDAPGAYRYPDREAGQRRARRRLDGLSVERWRIEGRGTVRVLSPGGTFELVGHPRFGLSATDPDAGRFAVLRVDHSGRNNLPTDFSNSLETLFGRVVGKQSAAPATNDDSPLYQNRFQALPITVAYAPLAPEDVAQEMGGRPGTPTHLRPRIGGTLTATVVGLDGAPVHTDRDHRIKVQFHFARGAASSSRLSHPAGDDNAPGSEAAGTWVRVAAPVAGGNWGGHFVPRLGQEVVVAFLDGDIDRPIVTGSLYNGKGSEDTPGNQANATAPANTPNAPAWFAGNAHPPVFSGFKTMALGASQSGQGGYSHLLFDDTPDQSRTQLATTQHATELTLGHHRAHDNGGDGVAGNARTTGLGHGASVATDSYGAVRGGAGVLISADARNGGAFGGSQQMDAKEARLQLSEAEALTQSLIDTAKNQQADIPADPKASKASPASSSSAGGNGAGASSGGTSGTGSKPPDTSTVIGAIQSTRQDLTGLTDDRGLTWSAPDHITSAPGGIAHLTPGPAAYSAGTHFHTTAGMGIEILAQQAARYHVKAGIRLFTFGSKPVGDTPLKTQGLRLHAAAGQVNLQAQSDQASLAAQKDVRITSTTANVSVSAKQHVLMTAKGAYLKIEGGSVQLHAPGTVTLKGGTKAFVSGQSANAMAAALPKARNLNDEQFVLKDELTGAPIVFAPYKIVTDDGDVFRGVTDEQGRTIRIATGSRSVGLKLLPDD